MFKEWLLHAARMTRRELGEAAKFTSFMLNGEFARVQIFQLQREISVKRGKFDHLVR